MWAQETVYKGSEPGIVPPRPAKKVKAQYDDSVRPEKIEGLVRIKMVISRDGKPRDITVLESLDPRLDAKAVEAAKQWQWEPAGLKGKPVSCGVVLEFYFKP